MRQFPTEKYNGYYKENRFMGVEKKKVLYVAAAILGIAGLYVLAE